MDLQENGDFSSFESVDNSEYETDDEEYVVTEDESDGSITG